MFESIEESFKLFDATNLKGLISLNVESLQNLHNYVKYCENELQLIIDNINLMCNPNKKCTLSVKKFEEIYENRIMYRVEDVANEMYMLQNFLLDEVKEVNDTLNLILDDMDGVETLLMMVPEEIEKMKCIKLALPKD